MRTADTTGVDLIKEFRLRQWARTHYVDTTQRGKNWHPIVLEEMRFRDAELEQAAADISWIRSPFVPLEPTEVHFIDEAHPPVPAPKSRELTGDVYGDSSSASRRQLDSVRL